MDTWSEQMSNNELPMKSSALSVVFHETYWHTPNASCIIVP